MAEIVLSFVIGGVFGALVMVAWMVDGEVRVSEPEPTEHGGHPL